MVKYSDNGCYKRQLGYSALILNMCLCKFCCIFAAICAVISAIEFQIKNNEGGQVWIGIQGNPGHQHLKNGGFSLGARQQVSPQ